MAEQFRRDMAKAVDLAVTAVDEIAQGIRRQFLHR
jgi:hypothetical protein